MALVGVIKNYRIDNYEIINDDNLEKETIGETLGILHSLLFENVVSPSRIPCFFLSKADREEETWT